jgi:hypothetical protein
MHLTLSIRVRFSRSAAPFYLLRRVRRGGLVHNALPPLLLVHVLLPGVSTNLLDLPATLRLKEVERVLHCYSRLSLIMLQQSYVRTINSPVYSSKNMAR